MSDTTRTRMLELGKLVMTAGVNAWCQEQPIRPIFLAASVARHSECDWGDLDDEDKDENDAAFIGGNRILSAYHSSDGVKIWIITEWDRSVTTILFPSEY